MIYCKCIKSVKFFSMKVLDKLFIEYMKLFTYLFGNVKI